MTQDILAVGYSSGELIAYLPANGRRLWTDTLTSTGRYTPLSAINDIAGKPTIQDGVVYAASHSGVLTAIDARSGARIWSRTFGSRQGPVIGGDYLFVVGTGGMVACFNKIDGKLAWKRELPEFKDGNRENRIVWTGPADRLRQAGHCLVGGRCPCAFRPERRDGVRDEGRPEHLHRTDRCGRQDFRSDRSGQPDRDQVGRPGPAPGVFAMTLTVAIVGRPNVGKSTLFNRLAGRKIAIVDDQPGVTRDRKEAMGRLGDIDMILIDTAGFEDVNDDSLEARMRSQTEIAINEADVSIFLYDARAGVTPIDERFAQLLRKSGKPVVLAANKCEGKQGDEGLMEAWRLGLGDPAPISAEHGEGMSDLFDALRQAFRRSLRLRASC